MRLLGMMPCPVKGDAQSAASPTNATRPTGQARLCICASFVVIELIGELHRIDRLREEATRLLALGGDHIPLRADVVTGGLGALRAIAHADTQCVLVPAGINHKADAAAIGLRQLPLFQIDQVGRGEQRQHRAQRFQVFGMLAESCDAPASPPSVE